MAGRKLRLSKGIEQKGPPAKNVKQTNKGVAPLSTQHYHVSCTRYIWRALEAFDCPLWHIFFLTGQVWLRRIGPGFLTWIFQRSCLVCVVCAPSMTTTNIDRTPHNHNNNAFPSSHLMPTKPPSEVVVKPLYLSLAFSAAGGIICLGLLVCQAWSILVGKKSKYPTAKSVRRNHTDVGRNIRL